MWLSLATRIGARPDIPGNRTIAILAEKPMRMNMLVMSRAEQGRILERGRTAVGPMPQVVGIAPVSWGVAAGVSAVTIAQPERAGLRWREESGRPTQINELALAAQDRGDDRGIAGQPAHLGRRQELTARGRPQHSPRTHAALEVIECHRHEHCRLGAECASARADSLRDSGPMAASRTARPSAVSTIR